MNLWLDKPYRSLDYEMKTRFGEKLYRITINAGATCPNRDGTLGDRGCIFCSLKGSGDFAGDVRLSISEQIAKGKSSLAKKRRIDSYIAYFQAFTNTYGEINVLERLYLEAIQDEQVKVLSIATRPDCLGDDVLDLIGRINETKPVWIELGLQTIHESTAKYIRRGYSLSVFEEKVKALRKMGIPVIVHVILCLPGESKEMMFETIDYLNSLQIQGIKLSLLHVLEDTDLAIEYKKEPFWIPTMEEYIELLGECIGRLNPAITIHRLTGDGPKELLIAPLWTSAKRTVLNEFHRYLKDKNIWQGMFQRKDYNMKENLALYKLIVLYLLNEVDFPMTTSQISEFILDQGYTTYFKLKEALAEMVEANFLLEESAHNRTLYHLTMEGAKTISYFGNKISPGIQEDIKKFLEEKQYDLKEEAGVQSNYFFSEEDGEYHVRCRIMENGKNMIDLKLIVPTEMEAKAIASKWLTDYEKIYAMLIANLL